MKTDTTMIVVGIAAATVALVYVMRKGAGNVAQAAATGAVRVVTDASTGIVLGVGDAVGVPRTDMTACQQAIAEGRTLDASFLCPATTWFKSLFSNNNPNDLGQFDTGTGGNNW